MPRYARLFLPKVPLHIVQRGHDRRPVFIQRQDYEYYLSNLVQAKEKFDVRLYAYCLMTSHVHLVVAPFGNPANISALMRTIAARQTRHVNRLEGRTGTLWEGRFKASLVDSDAYFLGCCRYVDLNPVRAGITEDPVDYEWSSYQYLSGSRAADWLDQNPVYRSLGKISTERGNSYRSFVQDGIAADELAMIRTAVARNQLTGGTRFRKELENRTGRRISVNAPGRPTRSRTGK